MPAQEFTPKYITYEDVLWQLQQKITVGTGEKGTFSVAQLNTLCAQAERKVENDMSERYLIPFQTKSLEAYDQLSDDTKMQIVDLCVVYTCYRILFKFFGSSSNVKGDLYWRVALSDYKAYLTTLLGKNEVGLFESSTLTDLAIDTKKFTGQDALPVAETSDPIKCRNYSVIAGRRLTSPASRRVFNKRVPSDGNS